MIACIQMIYVIYLKKLNYHVNAQIVCILSMMKNYVSVN